MMICKGIIWVPFHKAVERVFLKRLPILKKVDQHTGVKSLSKESSIRELLRKI